MENQGKKLAVLVGCNYPDGPVGSPLQGCINDVLAMEEVLISRFGFDPANIEVLTDDLESKVKPTGSNILNALNRMIENSKNGEFLFFEFSGHGTLVPHDQGKIGEAIIPWDNNLITDVDLRKLVNQLPEGVTFTVFSDSCNSGELIAQEKEQIGPSTDIIKDDTTTVSLSGKPRFVPIETLVQLLSSQSGINSPDVGTHLLALFGSEASLMFRQPQNHDAAVDVDVPDGGILLSGCQKDEFAIDLRPGLGVEKACGAFSNAVQIVLKKHEGPITNKELVKSARYVLYEQKIQEQHPCLYCSDSNTSATFLMEQPKI